jgi:hypothetical protein
MKRKLFGMAGVAAMLLSFMALAGCKTDADDGGGGGGSDNPFAGTWRGTADDGQRLTLNITDTTWEYDSNRYNVIRYSMKGTYTYSGNAGTMTVTHLKTDDEWESMAEYNMPATIVGNTLTVTSILSLSEDGTTATFTKDGDISNSISGTWSKGSGSNEKTLIISLTTGEWSSDAATDEWISSHSGKNMGGIFALTSETAGLLKTGNPNRTGNALLSGGTLYITGFTGEELPLVNGTYTKKNDYDDVGEYASWFS